MTEDTINLIKLQNKVDIELDQAIELIKPIVATGKKLTKRETKKAEALLKNHKLDIHVYLDRSGYFSQLKLFHNNRHIQSVNKDSLGYSYTNYINDDTRSILLDRETISLTVEDLDQWKHDIKPITVAEIKAEIKKHNELTKQIENLQSKKRDIKYRSYLE